MCVRVCVSVTRKNMCGCAKRTVVFLLMIGSTLADHGVPFSFHCPSGLSLSPFRGSCGSNMSSGASPRETKIRCHRGRTCSLILNWIRQNACLTASIWQVAQKSCVNNCRVLSPWLRRLHLCHHSEVISDLVMVGCHHCSLSHEWRGTAATIALYG